jgi:hypothetical protein
MIAIAAAGVAAVAVATTVTVREVRQHEWAHGGDALTATAEITLATKDTFEATVTRMGVPAGQATRYVDFEQTIVAHVAWSGGPPGDTLAMILLDGRVTPPRPLAAEGTWSRGEMTGSQWAGAYEVLPDHYDYLAGVASALHTDDLGLNRMPSAAVDGGSSDGGTVTAWFHQWGDGPIPFTDPSREIVVALVDQDSGGEVRWARRV